MDAQPAFRYKAVARDEDGWEVVEVFTSGVEYRAGDELPLSSARWRVDRVSLAGVEHRSEGTVTVRTLYCHLA